MSYPQAYEPQQDYMYQILIKTPYDRAYEHLDYAEDKADRKHLLDNYRDAYRGQVYTLKAIRLPRKYWKKN